MVKAPNLDRIRLVLLLPLICAPLIAGADEQLSILKVGGVVYSNVTVTSYSATDIYFTYRGGMGNAKLKNLEPAVQRMFHYDAQADAAAQKNAAKGPNSSDPKVAMNDAMEQVRKIVNQPVEPVKRTSDMMVSVFSPGWFHEGAERPKFETADVRVTQDTKPYDQHEYYSSDLNPGLAWRGKDLEFNPRTKFFYTDRTVPKKRLTEQEMVEINRLYRIIGDSEQKIAASQKAEACATTGGTSPFHFLGSYVGQALIGTVGIGFLLVGLNFARRKQSASA